MSDTATGTIDRDALDRYVGRVLKLHEERKFINGEIAVVYAEAKDAGFATKVLRQIVTEQKMEADQRDSHYALLDTYRHALGMLHGTPLGEAAISAVAAVPFPKPRPLAEQTIKRPASRRRKQRTLDELLADARGLADDMGPPAGAA